MASIPTARGAIKIEHPSSVLLRNLRSLLPFGACQLAPPEGGDGKFGIVMQCDEMEVFCIKQESVECSREDANRWMEIQHWICVEALSQFRAEGFSGAYLPAPYLRQRDSGLWETGISHFIFPSPTGIEAQEFPFDSAFDDGFGHGATIMLKRFLAHFKDAFLGSKLTSPQYFSLNVRPRLHLQSLAMYFLSVGPHLICLRENLREEEDPAWTILAGAGVETVYHMPCVPMAIKSEDLAVTKFAQPSE
jgi:hypothetical protein